MPIQPSCPISDAGGQLAHCDEHIARSPVETGRIERMHFADACASLRVVGELVNREDLHDAARDVRGERALPLVSQLIGKCKLRRVLPSPVSKSTITVWNHVAFRLKQPRVLREGYQ